MILQHFQFRSNYKLVTFVSLFFSERHLIMKSNHFISCLFYRKSLYKFEKDHSQSIQVLLQQKRHNRIHNEAWIVHF